MKVGDIVTLKSGGPLMTVSYVYVNGAGRPTGSYTCEWFDDMQISHSAMFENAVLDIVEVTP